MTICPLCGCLPEIIVTVEDIRVVDGHYFVAANFDGQLLYDSPAQVLDHGPVGIFTAQRDRKGQPCGSGDNHIVFAKVGEPDKQLLVLVDVARIVDDDHRLSQACVQICLKPLCIEVVRQPSNEYCLQQLLRMADFDFENPTFDPVGAWNRR